MCSRNFFLHNEPMRTHGHPRAPQVEARGPGGRKRRDERGHEGRVQPDGAEPEGARVTAGDDGRPESLARKSRNAGRHEPQEVGGSS